MEPVRYAGAGAGRAAAKVRRSRVIADGEEEELFSLWYEGVKVRVVLCCSLGAEERQAQTGGDLSLSNGQRRECRMRRVLFSKICVQYRRLSRGSSLDVMNFVLLCLWL